MNVIEEQASLQLSVLAEVSESLQKAGIDYWLFGGWAVDFYVGSVTRLHDDVDLAVWFVDVSQIAQLLLTKCWRHAPFDDEDGGTGFERGGVRDGPQGAGRLRSVTRREPRARSLRQSRASSAFAPAGSA